VTPRELVVVILQYCDALSQTHRSSISTEASGAEGHKAGDMEKDTQARN
jgi:hypothetical protein